MSHICIYRRIKSHYEAKIDTLCRLYKVIIYADRRFSILQFICAKEQKSGRNSLLRIAMSVAVHTSVDQLSIMCKKCFSDSAHSSPYTGHSVQI